MTRKARALMGLAGWLMAASISTAQSSEERRQSKRASPAFLEFCAEFMEREHTPELFAKSLETPELPSELPEAEYISLLGKTIPVPAGVEFVNVGLLHSNSRGFPTGVMIFNKSGTLGLTVTHLAEDDMFPEHEFYFDHAYAIDPDSIDCGADDNADGVVAMALKTMDEPTQTVPEVYRTEWGWLRTWEKSDGDEQVWEGRYVLSDAAYFSAKWVLPWKMKNFGWLMLNPKPITDETSNFARIAKCIEKQDLECLYKIEGVNISRRR